MESVLRLRQAIADLNREARRELADAASDGRFDELVDLTPMTKEISSLAARWAPQPQPASINQPSQVQRPQANGDPATSKEIGNAGLDKLTRADYPRFLREKHEMVKLGWSAREDGSYEHRVPKGCVDAVCATVAATGKGGTRFAIGDILEAVTRPGSEDRVPSYQAYAVVSWLKWAGMVLQHGRKGYTVIRPQTFKASVEAAWRALPQR